MPAGLSDPLAPLILKAGFASSYASEPEPYRFTPAQAAATEMAAGDAVAALDNARRINASTTIQLGTFSDPANASRIADHFAGYGEVVIAEVPRRQGLRIVRVRTIDPQSVLAAARRVRPVGTFIVSPSN